MQSPHHGATMTDPGITCRKQCNLHPSGLKLSVKQFVFFQKFILYGGKESSSSSAASMVSLAGLVLTGRANPEK